MEAFHSVNHRGFKHRMKVFNALTRATGEREIWQMKAEYRLSGELRDKLRLECRYLGAPNLDDPLVMKQHGINRMFSQNLSSRSFDGFIGITNAYDHSIRTLEHDESCWRVKVLADAIIDHGLYDEITSASEAYEVCQAHAQAIWDIQHESGAAPVYRGLASTVSRARARVSSPSSAIDRELDEYWGNTIREEADGENDGEDGAAASGARRHCG